MLVYHRTHHAQAILQDGFRDGYWFTPGIGKPRGAFVSAGWPLDENEGARGDIVLALDVPEALFVAFELVEQGKTYREAMIPAARLNDYRATLSLAVSEEEIVAVFCERCSG